MAVVGNHQQATAIELKGDQAYVTNPVVGMTYPKMKDTEDVAHDDSE